MAEALSLLKKLSSGSNEALLQYVEDKVLIAGLPVITTTDVDAGTLAWGVDATQQRLVLRKATEVRKFDSITNDGVWVRAIARVSWDTLNPAGIVRIWDAA